MEHKIILPAGPNDDLTWDRHEAEVCKAKGQSILWELDWGTYSQVGTDSAVFAAQALALETWKSTFSADFLENTAGIILYRGKFPILDGELLEWYCHWLESREDTLFNRRLYSSEYLYAYLHRLGSFLPDTIPLIVHLEASEITSRAQQAILFSTERTLHLQLIVEGAKISVGVSTATRGICLPSEEQWTDEVMQKLEELLERWNDGAPRLIPERLLNEQWDGVDELVVMETTLSARGKRMLQGFAAAGGKICLV